MIYRNVRVSFAQLAKLCLAFLSISISCHSFAMTASQAVDFGKIIANEGASSAVQTPMPSASLVGASASGSGAAASSTISATSRLEGGVTLACAPTFAAARPMSLSGLSTRCEDLGSGVFKLHVCMANSQGATARDDCANGAWYSSTPISPFAEDLLTTGLRYKFTACTGSKCTFTIIRESSYNNSAYGIGSDGSAALATESLVSDSPASLVQGMGVYGSDGSVIIPGTNSNTGDYISTVLTEGTLMSTCIQAAHTSLEGGTPVYTCDGSQSVNITSGTCTNTSSCLNWVMQTNTWEDFCDVSLNITGASCTTVTPTQTCQIDNTRTTFTCRKYRESTVITQLHYTKRTANCTKVDYEQASGGGTYVYYYYDASQWKTEWDDYDGFTNVVPGIIDPGLTNHVYEWARAVANLQVSSPSGKVWEYFEDNTYPSAVYTTGTQFLGGGSRPRIYPYTSTDADGNANGACNCDQWWLSSQGRWKYFCDQPYKDEPCDAGFTESGGVCWQNVSIPSGYSLYSSNPAIIPGKDNPVYAYYVKYDNVNECVTYETNQ